MKNIAEIIGVSRAFSVSGGEFYALKNINLEIPENKLTILRGKSGSGKTTLMNIIGALDYPTTGQIMMDGRDIVKMSDRKREKLRRTQFGFVFQSVSLIPTMNAYQNVEYALRMAGIKGNHKARVEECLKMVGLGGRMTHMPSELSGGEQQRVALARALANNASMIIADEPTGNIDPRMSYDIVNLLNHINSDGTTVIMVTHDYHLVKTFNHRVITIKNGKLESDYPDASHIDVEPYRFDNPEDEVGTYYSDDTTVDFDYLMKTYGVETIETKDENPFVDIPTEPKNFRPNETYSIFNEEDEQ